MASEASISCASIPTVKAICIKNHDLWRQQNCEELHIGEVYTPDYFVIGKSWSYLYVSEFPGCEYTTVMFDYQDGDGNRIDFRTDIIRPIMERYREYLWNEMHLTGTWEVYVKLNDTPPSPANRRTSSSNRTSGSSKTTPSRPRPQAQDGSRHVLLVKYSYLCHRRSDARLLLLTPGAALQQCSVAPF